MFSRSALVGATFVALCSTAMAADLPSRTAGPSSLVIPFGWTGFYVGGHAGYVFNDDNLIRTIGNNGPVAGPSTIFNVATGARPALTRAEPEGFTGGGQAGYNLQIGSVLVGIEADAAFTDYRHTVGVVGTTGALSTFRTDMSFLGTVRGRVGYVMDRFMAYGTGGFAYGDVQNSALFFATPAAGGTGVVQFSGSRGEIEVGYAAGAGVEYALPASVGAFGSSAVTVKAEALYYDLGRNGITVADTGLAPAATRGQSYTSRFDTNGIVARAGVNFKFGTF